MALQYWPHAFRNSKMRICVKLPLAGLQKNQRLIRVPLSTEFFSKRRKNYTFWRETRATWPQIEKISDRALDFNNLWCLKFSNCQNTALPVFFFNFSFTSCLPLLSQSKNRSSEEFWSVKRSTTTNVTWALKVSPTRLLNSQLQIVAKSRNLNRAPDSAINGGFPVKTGSCPRAMADLRLGIPRLTLGDLLNLNQRFYQ